MEQEIERVVQAIAVASDPAQTNLHPDALAYLSTIEQNAAESWRIALALFVDTAPDGARKHPPQVRFFALRVLDDFFESQCVAAFFIARLFSFKGKDLCHLPRTRSKLYSKLWSTTFNQNTCTAPLKQTQHVRAVLVAAKAH